jgi:hypothetical protein
MAKEDFCFTYYDGDAARDTTHMNRLERGAYHDLIISQRKFGHLSLDQCKKILGKDFADCWPSLELILKTADGKFFIEWLDISIRKAKKHSKKQSENVTKRYQKSTNQLPKEPTVTPLEDGNGDGNESEDVSKKEGAGENNDTSSFQYDFVSGDVELEPCEGWTAQILDGNDTYFLNMVRGRNLNLNGSLDRLARDHLGLIARYKWHRTIDTQQAFRLSLLNHISKELKDEPGKQPKDKIAERKRKFESQ